MKMSKFFSGLLIVAIAASMTGCSLFRSDDAGPTGTPITPPGGDPRTEVLKVDVEDDEGWVKDANTIPGQPGDFIPIPNQHFPSIYFAYNRDVIGTAEQNKIDSVAKLMIDRPEICLIIEGHCDERGSLEYNRALGERRAIAVKGYFLNKGIADDRFKTISYGEERPAVEGTDESARSKNRRAALIPAKRR
jgi:peptidoglycan-associated lipoprotein